MGKIQFLSSINEAVEAAHVPFLSGVKVSGRSKTKSVDAIIDTASTVSAIPSTILAELGIKKTFIFRSGEPIVGGTQKISSNALYPVKLKICNFPERKIYATKSNEPLAKIARDVFHGCELTISWAEPTVKKKNKLHLKL